MVGGVNPEDGRIGHPTFTAGSGRKDPQGVPVPVPEGGVVAGWKAALEAIRPTECAWWSPHIWSGNYARAEDWIGAHAVSVDLDFNDPRLGRDQHVEVPTNFWSDLYQLAMNGGVWCNLLHSTPRGARAIIIFERACTSRTEIAAAVHAAAKQIADSIDKAGLSAQVPQGGLVRAGFRVDRSCFNLKALFWAPNCTVNGNPRMAEVHIVDKELVDPGGLAASEPMPEPIVSPGVGTGSDEYSVAARRWCDDHPDDFRRPKRQCPACEHRDCFGPCPEAPDRWFCFSANHHWDSGGCGAPSKSQPDAYWGDALDLEAHQRGCEPHDVLRQDGYLTDAQRDSVDIVGILRQGQPDTVTRIDPTPRRLNGEAVAPDKLVDNPAPEPRKVQKNPNEYEILSLEDVLKIEAPPPMVRGMLRQRDLAVLFGAPGCGKSFVAIALALSVASGESWLGMEVEGPSRVLYIAGEGSYGIGKRVMAWGGGQDLRLKSPIFQNWHQINDLVEFLDTKSITGLARAINKMGEAPTLIVVDTLARAMTGGDENSSKDMSNLVKRCGEIRDGTGATVLLVHHTGKSGPAERGHSALRGAADVMMSLEKQDDGTVRLAVDKSKDDECADPIDIELRRVCLGVDSYGMPRSSLRADVVDPSHPRADALGGAPMQIMGVLLAETGSSPWVTYKAIMEATNLHRNKVTKCIKQLFDEGRILTRQSGRVKEAMARPDAPGAS